jgi:hypothetical protein
LDIPEQFTVEVKIKFLKKKRETWINTKCF